MKLLGLRPKVSLASSVQIPFPHCNYWIKIINIKNLGVLKVAIEKSCETKLWLGLTTVGKLFILKLLNLLIWMELGTLMISFLIQTFGGSNVTIES